MLNSKWRKQTFRVKK